MDSGRRRLAAVMFTDMVGYSTISERDEPLALQLLRPLFAHHQGREIKTIGDGFLVEFDSAAEATECAVEIQRGLHDRNQRSPSEAIVIRIGVHVGEVTHLQDDVFGDAVNVASRIVPLARPGGVSASRTVLDQLRSRTEFSWKALPLEPLRGLRFPPAVFELELPWLPVEAGRAARPKSLPRAGALHREVPLVDREGALERLRAFVDLLSEGRGGALLLSGEPGIGKSRLVREAVAIARGRGIRVQVAFCLDVAGSGPYAPWVEILRRLAREETPESLLRYCGPYAWDVARLSRDVGDRIGTVAGPGEGEPTQERSRFFEGVTEFFQRMSRDLPALLVLEDLSGADPDSLQLLRHLVRNAQEAPLGLLATHSESDSDDHPALGELLSRLHRDRLAETIRLTPFEPSDSAQLIQGVLGGSLGVPAQIAPLIYEKTSGNPFGIEEVVYDLVEGNTLIATKHGWRLQPGARVRLPLTVRKVIQKRLARLAPRTLTVLRLASVLGSEFDVDLLRRLSRTRRERLADLLEPAIRAGLLDEERHRSGRTVGRFRDRQIHETLYQDLSLARRQLLHRRAAQALETESPVPSNGQVDEIAHHYLEANEPAKAVEHALLAAERATRLFAYEDAANYLRAALELAGPNFDARSRALLFERLAHAASIQGQLQPATEGYRKAAELYLSLGESRHAGDLLRRAALTIWNLANDVGAYSEAFEAALRVLDTQPECPELARLLAEGGLALTWLGEIDRGRQVAERALESSVAMGLPDVEAMACTDLCASTSVGRKARGIAYLDRWERLVGSDAPTVPLAVGGDQYVSAAFVELSARGNWSGAIELLERAREAARKPRFFETVAYLQYILSGRYFEAGRTDDGRHACEEVERLVEKYGFSGRFYLDALANRQFYEGNLEAARGQLHSVMDEILTTAPRHRGLIGFFEFAGRIAAAQSRFDEAREYSERCKQAAREHGLPLDSALSLVLAYGTLIEALVRSGQVSGAETNLDELRTLVTQLDHDLARGHLYRADGQVHGARHDWPAAIDSFRKAVRTWEGIGWSYWGSIARTELGAALHEAGRNEEAHVVLRKALSEFRRMTLAPWVERASDQLKRVGGAVTK